MDKEILIEENERKHVDVKQEIMSNNSPAAIEVKGISKTYHFAKAKGVSKPEIFLALDDISFTIYKGDAVAVIGSNGSGKTTLLKILSQITKPTSGEARFYGSVSSILEIGTNFHPDLSGRENVIMQMRLAKVDSGKYGIYQKEILEFSEIGEFFDQPIKYYSSGMFLRLAFSLAFHLSSDILILDEVLSVGDEGFRLKCQELIKKFIQHGKTILFVSHSRMEILEWSTKCIWLDKGVIKRIGESPKILSEYFGMHRDSFEATKLVIDTQGPHIVNKAKQNDALDLNWEAEQAPGNDVIAIRHLSVKPHDGTDKLYNTLPIHVKFVIDKKKKGIMIGATFFLQDVFYQPVLVAHFLNNTEHANHSEGLKNETGLIEIKSTIPANFLTGGKYFFLVRFGMEENQWNPESSEAFRFSEDMSFMVHNSEGYQDFISDPSKGAVRPLLDWKIKKLPL